MQDWDHIWCGHLSLKVPGFLGIAVDKDTCVSDHVTLEEFGSNTYMIGNLGQLCPSMTSFIQWAVEFKVQMAFFS